MTTKIQTIIENTGELNADQRRAVGVIARAQHETLAGAEKLLRDVFPGWFVYRGGSHVALHAANRPTRVLLVTERRAD